MKQHRNITARQEALSERSLFAAVLTLKTVDECRAFFRDLCTLRELHDLAQRWHVVRLLDEGRPYVAISQATGASTATITRIAQWLHHGTGGYRDALARSASATAGRRSAAASGGRR